jgi:hypothetical protein
LRRIGSEFLVLDFLYVLIDWLLWLG